MKIQLSALALALSLSSLAHGSDLLSIYRMAVENDTGYLAADFQRQATGQQAAIAESAFKPSVSVSGGLNLNHDDVNGAGSDTYGSGSIQISLSKSLYNKQSSIAIEQAEKSGEKAEYDFESAGDSLVLRVADAYFSALGAIDNYDLAVSEKIAIKRQLELAEERLNVGIGTQTDLFDARARFQIVEANELEAANLIEESIEALIAIIGEDPGELSKLSDETPLEPPTPNTVDVWVETALANNPQLKSAAVDLEIARREIEVQQNTLSPTVSVNLSQSFADSNGGIGSTGSERYNTSAGISFAKPLYAGGADKAQVLQASLQANAQEQLLEQVRRQTAQSVRDVFNDVNTGIRRVMALEQAVVASESAVDAKNEGFSAGLITNLDVLDAQRDLFQAQRDYLRARYNYILSLLSLEQAAGQLDEEDVARVNQWLE